jgi:hypothetical protein
MSKKWDRIQGKNIAKHQERWTNSHYNLSSNINMFVETQETQKKLEILSQENLLVFESVRQRLKLNDYTVTKEEYQIFLDLAKTNYIKGRFNKRHLENMISMCETRMNKKI